MLGEGVTRRSFLDACRDADLALVEGAMGLFDGLDLMGTNSTAQLARLLGLPVILLVDVTRMTRTAAAVVRGLLSFEQGISFAGVILNRVGTSRQEHLVRQAVESCAGLPVLGAIARWPAAAVPDRHLGLIPAGERLRGGRLAAREAIRAAAAAVEAGVDVDRLLEVSAPIACAADQVTNPGAVPEDGAVPAPGVVGGPAGESRDGEEPVPVGVVRDRVFSFYYPENLEALERAGARLLTVDSLSHSRLPRVAALYIGGGFPEVFARELEGNVSLRTSLREAIAAGLPVYAECGGLMYLCRSISWRGIRHEMVGALPFDVEMAGSPRGHGYVEAEVVGPNPYFPQGGVLRAHEFHHSLPTTVPVENMVLRLRRGTGWGQGYDGLRWGSVFASYLHVHALACPGWAVALVREARRFDRERRGVAAWW
jgi:cobyrinic acid a,c-diamide synthase